MPQRSGHEARSSSSCAACKLLKRRCGPSCIFAPYFRSDEPKKFAKVHKVFGASNVSKILGEVPEEQREDTVNSLAYEAEARLRDPVYGCIGAIAILQRKMAELQHDLAVARARLARAAATAAATSSVGTSGGLEYYDNPHVIVNNVGPAFGDVGYYSCGSGPYNESFSQVPMEWSQDFGGGMSDYFGHSPFMLGYF
ncbi:LOB domain-containing protein 21-like [Punica granatum]|uniref:LOB domain-containing protein n=2 Tax=Punica granatum TaxID=22663 RepID=A0A218WAN7_PUNGR|nr:LOB domain-containing protein 21-like [Punica granatum]OWM69937.1 hypothetical protein CDL15_Pgr025786 [Punica granatum]PKI39538.1 hypothetical protein CRG98_040008 [Punica granatum]